MSFQFNPCAPCCSNTGICCGGVCPDTWCVKFIPFVGIGNLIFDNSTKSWNGDIIYLYPDTYGITANIKFGLLRLHLTISGNIAILHYQIFTKIYDDPNYTAPTKEGILTANIICDGTTPSIIFSLENTVFPLISTSLSFTVGSCPITDTICLHDECVSPSHTTPEGYYWTYDSSFGIDGDQIFNLCNHVIRTTDCLYENKASINPPAVPILNLWMCTETRLELIDGFWILTIVFDYDFLTGSPPYIHWIAHPTLVYKCAAIDFTRYLSNKFLYVSGTIPTPVGATTVTIPNSLTLFPNCLYSCQNSIDNIQSSNLTQYCPSTGIPFGLYCIIEWPGTIFDGLTIPMISGCSGGWGGFWLINNNIQVYINLICASPFRFRMDVSCSTITTGLIDTFCGKRISPIVNVGIIQIFSMGISGYDSLTCSPFTTVSKPLIATLASGGGCFTGSTLPCKLHFTE